MCSVTHRRSPSEILLTMNRDEDRRRISEVPPQVHSAPGQKSWMAPADGEPLNTWIAVNQAGFGGCILNRYPDLKAPAEKLSRGTLLPAMLEQTTPSDLAGWLWRILSQESFSPFTLIVIDRLQTARFDWDGRKLLAAEDILATGCTGEANGADWTLHTSSSWRSRSVTRWRSRQFRLWLEEGASFHGHIPAFHLLQPASLEAWAPLMSRRLTSTRSLTQIHVDLANQRVDLRYWPSPFSRRRAPSSHLSLRLDEMGIGS